MHPRIRPGIRILFRRRRDTVRAHQRAERHHPRIDAPLAGLEIRNRHQLDKERAVVWRQDAVGRQHQRAAAGRALGAGVQRGANDC